MKKAGFIFQKVVLGAVLIGTLVTVIPFILLIADMSVNGEDSLAAVMFSYLFTKYDDYMVDSE